LISLLIWFIFEFKNKEFSPTVNNDIPVTVNPPSVTSNTQINQTNINNQNFQLNASINVYIDKIYVNQTN
jgi:hypothetical protein